MSPRRFSKRCAECRQKTMAIAVVPYDIQIDHDGKKYDVHVPALSVPQCADCGALSIDEVASAQIDDAFRQKAGLLSPADIRSNRIRLGFDGVLRAFFALPSLRGFLAQIHGLVQPAQSVITSGEGSSNTTFSMSGSLLLTTSVTSTSTVSPRTERLQVGTENRYLSVPVALLAQIH